MLAAGACTKLVEAVLEGYRPAGLQQLLEELETKKATLEKELAAAGPAAPEPGLVGQGGCGCLMPAGQRPW